MFLQTIAGSETFSASNGGPLNAGSVQIAQFIRRTGSLPDVPLQTATRDPSNGVDLIGTAEQLPASRQNRNHGVWTIARHVVPEGSYITLSIKKKLGRDFVFATGLFMLEVREHAAFRRLRIPLTGNPNASLQTGVIEGHFDLVPFDDLGTLQLPFNNFVPDHFIQDPTEWFEDVIVERETRRKQVITKETVVTETGRTIEVKRAPKARVIRVNRKT